MDVIWEGYDGGESFAIWMVFVGDLSTVAWGYVLCRDVYYDIFRSSFRTLKWAISFLLTELSSSKESWLHAQVGVGLVLHILGAPDAPIDAGLTNECISVQVVMWDFLGVTIWLISRLFVSHFTFAWPLFWPSERGYFVINTLRQLGMNRQVHDTVT